MVVPYGTSGGARREEELVAVRLDRRVVVRRRVLVVEVRRGRAQRAGDETGPSRTLR